MALNSEMKPASETELAAMISEAAAARVALEISGAGSKRAIGRPTNISHSLSTSLMRGITLYEPNEMVMSARAGTPLADVQAALARNNQMLPFEAADLGPALGTDSHYATIGAVFATNTSGSRRVAAGAARDHLLGVRAVNGRGEIFKNGGRVMKNVTGYDVARGLCGSWGTLAVMSEVTFKVVPAPRASASLVLLDLPDELAIEALTAVMGTPFEISGAVHIHASRAQLLRHAGLRSQGKAVTAFRLEADPKSIAYRRGRLIDFLKVYGSIHDLDQPNSEPFWAEVNALSMFPANPRPLWRISTAPTKGPAVVKAISRYMHAEAVYDWSGGLIWIEVPETADAGAADVRRVVAAHGGHATLIRATPEARIATDVFQPPEPGVLRLSQKLKAAFDPANILNPGRMYVAF